MLYWENSHILGVCFTRLCFKLNNLTGQKFGMSELKLSWPVTLTGDPPAVISRPGGAPYPTSPVNPPYNTLYCTYF